MSITIKQGDCLEVLATLPENSLDACVTDPPYGLGTVKDVAGLMMEWLNNRDGHEHVGGSGFMSRQWDRSVPSPRMWRELYRVLKPGAYALVFAGSRTSDLMGLSLRLAGFELVDSIFYCFGAGFPKGADVGKMIDRAQGMEREVVGVVDTRSSFDGKERKSEAINTNWRSAEGRTDVRDLSKKNITAPATPDAQLWDGYRSQLKPAHEPILICRKPLDGTIAQNALKWGTAGAFNIEATRVGTGKRVPGSLSKSKGERCLGKFNLETGNESGHNPNVGRYPANLILQHAHDCDESGCGLSCPVKLMGEQSGVLGRGGFPAKRNKEKQVNTYGRYGDETNGISRRTDTGTAARYFTQINPDPFIYSGKATKKDRTCNGAVTNTHPTVKSRALIKHLIKLIMPPSPDAVVIDPFGGSGTTGVAAKELGRNAILIEREPEYVELINARIEATNEPKESDIAQLSLDVI
jgi:site-specific DNA-methyltransferase (adenine-specific)